MHKQTKVLNQKIRPISAQKIEDSLRLVLINHTSNFILFFNLQLLNPFCIKVVTLFDNLHEYNAAVMRLCKEMTNVNWDVKQPKQRNKD